MRGTAALALWTVVLVLDTVSDALAGLADQVADSGAPRGEAGRGDADRVG